MLFSEPELSVLQTIGYFHFFNFPLTAFEVYKNLWRPKRMYSLSEIISSLNNLVKNKILGFHEGFYFIKSAGNPVEERKRRYLLAQKKIKRAVFFIKLIGRLPFVKAVFICNDTAYKNAPSGSDIDLAIVCSTGKIWTARFYSTLLIKFLGQRPTPENHENKICLSFYLTEDGLNMERFAYDDDIHFIYWLNQFLPVYDPNNLIENFYLQNNWTRKFLPNSLWNAGSPRWSVGSEEKVKKFFGEIFSGRLGYLHEKFLRSIQLKIMPKHLLALSMEENSNVVINDKILKFHDKDNRLEILARWRRLVASLIETN